MKTPLITQAILLALACSLFSFLSANGQCSLPAPSGVSVPSHTSCDATLTWSNVAGAAFYQVKYKVSSATNWTKITDHLTATSYTFSNLTNNVTYKFAVAAYCSSGNGSDWTTTTKKTDATTIPANVSLASAGGTYITFSWTDQCPATSFNIRYKVNGTQAWTIIKNVPSSPYSVIGLTPGTDYRFGVQAQMNTDTSKWTATVMFNSGVEQSANKPNIILYLLDDGRYDAFTPNGAPDWFNTPAINRIANEGINFRFTFPTTSQCGPSRSSIYTGLYAHKTGIVDNSSTPYPGLTMIQQVLHDAGYFTGFIGKYGQGEGDPDGFDWWLISKTTDYINPPYTINGKDTSISGHISDVYQWAATTFLNKVPPGKKFMLMFFTRAPHGPTVPRNEDTALFTSNVMPVPPSFTRYKDDYPSYFYNNNHLWVYDSSETVVEKRRDFQCLNGVERNVSALLNWLQTKSLLDSTLFMFTSDNGFLEGEHMLSGKQLGQENSIRLPLFIRYPKWFPAGTVNTTIQAMNIDIAPTMLEAAGIPDTIDWDGTSLHKLFNGTAKRKYFFYQFFNQGNTPSIRGVRTMDYIYLKHYCTSITEEFYDLKNDPQENINQINNSQYSSLITTYREAMDSIMTSLHDTTPASINCSLVNAVRDDQVDEETFDVRKMNASPNPASQIFLLSFYDEIREDIQISIMNLNGQQVYFKSLPNTNSFSIPIETESWVKGLYLISLKKGNASYSDMITIQ